MPGSAYTADDCHECASYDKATESCRWNYRHEGAGQTFEEYSEENPDKVALFDGCVVFDFSS